MVIKMQNLKNALKGVQSHFQFSILKCKWWIELEAIASHLSWPRFLGSSLEVDKIRKQIQIIICVNWDRKGLRILLQISESNDPRYYRN